MSRINGFRAWDDEFDSEIYTPEEIAESNLQAALISALIEARQERGLSQRELEALCGIKQPQIARIEKGETSPRLDTLLKVLGALGKTLEIVPITTKA